MLLVEFIGSFAPNTAGNAGARHEVAFVGGIDEDACRDAERIHFFRLGNRAAELVERGEIEGGRLNRRVVFLTSVDTVLVDHLDLMLFKESEKAASHMCIPG